MLVFRPRYWIRIREFLKIDTGVIFNQILMYEVMHSWVYDDQQPRFEDNSRFSTDVQKKSERRNESKFPETAKLLVKRLLSRKERLDHLGALMTWE